MQVMLANSGVMDTGTHHYIPDVVIIIDKPDESVFFSKNCTYAINARQWRIGEQAVYNLRLYLIAWCSEGQSIEQMPFSIARFTQRTHCDRLQRCGVERCVPNHLSPYKLKSSVCFDSVLLMPEDRFCPGLAFSGGIGLKAISGVEFF